MNTQQYLLTPPDRGERALSIWVEIKNIMTILNRPPRAVGAIFGGFPGSRTLETIIDRSGTIFYP